MLLYEDLSDEILKSAILVHKELGSGFLERIYEVALEYELNKLGHVVVRQQQLNVFYKEICAGEFYADMVVDNKIIIELKAVKQIEHAHYSQLRHYLNASGYRVGLLLNFGEPRLGIRRIIN